jgi:hypothetical protein
MLACLVVVTVAACGSDQLSKREYGDKAIRIVEALNTTQLFQGGTTQTPGEIADDQRRFRGVAERLSELDPPDSARRLNDRLVTTLRGLANALEPARRFAEAGRKDRSAQLLGDMPHNPATERWYQAALALAHYRFGPNASPGE